MSFHVKNYRSSDSSFRQRLWNFIDDNPPPAVVGYAARDAISFLRLVRHRLKFGRSNYLYDQVRNFEVPGDHFLPARQFAPLPRPEAKAWFERVHAANEAVYLGDGSWCPQPFTEYHGAGIPVEESALRIPGYLSAYIATSEQQYLERAQEASQYLLKHRVFADGHVLLQGHLVADFCYSIAARALLDMWAFDSTRDDCLNAAIRIAEQLLHLPISGSINHAGIPAMVFGPLYRRTGDRRYLRAMLRRVARRVLAFQLPSGDWDGHEGRLWYQGVNLRSLIEAYVATPFAPEFISAKRALARAIYRAGNWFIRLQDETGALPLTRWSAFDPDHSDAAAIPWSSEVAFWRDGAFERSPLPEAYLGHGAYEIDGMLNLYQQLGAREILPVIHGYAARIAATGRVWRLEFNTLGAGRYLRLVHDLEARRPSVARDHAMR